MQYFQAMDRDEVHCLSIAGRSLKYPCKAVTLLRSILEPYLHQFYPNQAQTALETGQKLLYPSLPIVPFTNDDIWWRNFIHRLSIRALRTVRGSKQFLYVLYKKLRLQHQLSRIPMCYSKSRRNSNFGLSLILKMIFLLQLFR